MKNLLPLSQQIASNRLIHDNPVQAAKSLQSALEAGTMNEITLTLKQIIDAFGSVQNIASLTPLPWRPSGASATGGLLQERAQE